MSEIRYEDTAREIAQSVMGRYNLRIPREMLPEVVEMMKEAALDGAEFGEALAGLDDNNAAHVHKEQKMRGLTRYTLGYLHAMTDIELGQSIQEGEL